MATVEHLDFRTITYEAALAFARVKSDALRDDDAQLAFQPRHAHLDDASLPPICEYEQLLARARRFERRVVTLAKQLHTSVRSSWRQHLFLARDAAGAPIAGALWVLPQYHAKPLHPPSLWCRLKTLLLRAWYYVTLIGRRDDLHDQPLGAVYRTVTAECLCKDTAERVQQLEHMSARELRATSYPHSLAYYLDLFVVRPDQQSKHVGKWLLDETLAFIRSQAVPPPSLAARAPPKATLLSVPKARGFYKKYGFTAGLSAERVGNNSEHIVFTYYFMNLDGIKS